MRKIHIFYTRLTRSGLSPGGQSKPHKPQRSFKVVVKRQWHERKTKNSTDRLHPHPRISVFKISKPTFALFASSRGTISDTFRTHWDTLQNFSPSLPPLPYVQNSERLRALRVEKFRYVWPRSNTLFKSRWTKFNRATAGFESYAQILPSLPN
jgi:hypothetical protein